MICARFSDAPAYRGILPLLDRALALLTPEFLESVGPEKLPLEGDALYATRFEYETLPPEETFFEAHRRYLDIHVVLRGEERIDVAHPDALTEFAQEGDFRGYRGEAEQSVLLRPGTFLVVFPGDAHRVKMQAGSRSEAVTKIVFKILYRD